MQIELQIHLLGTVCVTWFGLAILILYRDALYARVALGQMLVWFILLR